MNKTRYSATEFGGNKPMNFRLSGTLRNLNISEQSQDAQKVHVCAVIKGHTVPECTLVFS